MKDKYFKTAINLELENQELRRRYINLEKYFRRMIGFFCIFFLIIGITFLIIQYEIGFQEGVKEGIAQSEVNCINKMCEVGYCSDWASFDYINKTCNYLTNDKR